jgi:hypothetical protein
MSDSEDSDFDYDEDDEKFMQMMLQKRMAESNPLNEVVSHISKTQYEISKIREEVNLNMILTFVGECLKKMKNYRVIGGKAIQNWLNPTYHGMSTEERKYAKSDDWDIEVMGNNNDAKTFIKNLNIELTKKFGNNFTTRMTDTLALDSGEYVYQIGVDEERKTTWFVDVHAVKNINEDENVKINGIVYPKLVVLIEHINEMFNSGSGFTKGVKRFSRKAILEKALIDIYYFNPEVYNEIFRQCKQLGVENMTGANLNCKALEKFFPSSPVKHINSPKKKRLE